MNSDFKNFLESNGLIEFHSIIIDRLGCESIEDLSEIDENMLLENNIKPIQRKKLLNKLNQMKLEINFKIGKKKEIKFSLPNSITK